MSQNIFWYLGYQDTPSFPRLTYLVPTYVSKIVFQGVLTEAGWATFEFGDDTITSREVEAIDNNQCGQLLDQSGLEFINCKGSPD